MADLDEVWTQTDGKPQMKKEVKMEERGGKDQREGESKGKV